MRLVETGQVYYALSRRWKQVDTDPVSLPVFEVSACFSVFFFPCGEGIYLQKMKVHVRWLCFSEVAVMRVDASTRREFIPSDLSRFNACALPVCSFKRCRNVHVRLR